MLALAAPYLPPDQDELILQTTATSLIASRLDQAKPGERPYRSCDASNPPIRDGSFDSPRIKAFTTGAFESWHFDIALIQNSTKFFFAWHASDPLHGGYDPQLIVEFTLPNGTHHTSVTKGNMVYRHDAANGYSLSIGKNSFTWTDDAKWYTLKVDTENFQASLTYENMLPLAFVPRQYDESFAILPHFNVIVPIPRAHVDGWVQFASGERWAIQNVGFHDHRWGQQSRMAKVTTDVIPLTGYILDYDVCNEEGHYHIAALQEISTECAPATGKKRISLGLTGMSIREDRVTEKVDWGVGHIEHHHKCTMSKASEETGNASELSDEEAVRNHESYAIRTIRDIRKCSASGHSARTTPGLLTAALSSLRASYNTCKSAGPTAISAKRQSMLFLEALQHGVEELTALFEPKDSVTLMTGRFIETKALVAAVELGVAEALGGTKMSIAELAIAVGADQGKLRQIMSLLTNRCVFSQDGDEFSNNAVSTLLRQDDPMSMKSLVSHWGTDTYRAALSLPEGLLTKNALKSPWELQVGQTFYKWLHEPENAASSTRVNNAMQSFNGSIQSDLVNGFDWSSLGDAATLVDVGGGTGAIDLALLKQWPNLSVELQDLPDVIEQAETVSCGAVCTLKPGQWKLTLAQSFDLV
ncbi:hypothetical protein HDU86_008415 [Geranomyces michiganensis]|nr:hypothetical protein HDU86_008415 [Geranomyces michiganensis]